MNIGLFLVNNSQGAQSFPETSKFLMTVLEQIVSFSVTALLTFYFIDKFKLQRDEKRNLIASLISNINELVPPSGDPHDLMKDLNKAMLIFSNHPNILIKLRAVKTTQEPEKTDLLIGAIMLMCKETGYPILREDIQIPFTAKP